MKVKHIINHIVEKGTWVDWDETRDIILSGTDSLDIEKIGVCWVATNKVIEQAIKQNIHFIISHENPFYHLSTAPQALVLESAKRKKELLLSNNITLYRCHDVWDKIPNVGVADIWADRLGFSFQRDINSYIQHAEITEMTVEKLAKHVVDCLYEDGEHGVYVFGNPNKKIRQLGIGTGAATNIFQMLKHPCDACIVSDDGISNYYHAQYAIDNDLPLIVVNHSCCEIAGIKSMANYLEKQFPKIQVSYLEEGYTIHYYTK